jgi:hypothetical protein
VILLGRTMQVLALTYLPIGLYRGFTAGDLRGEMVFLAFGTLLFLGGRWIESRRRGR